MATFTLDCKCEKYFIQIHVGTDNSFTNVLLYEVGKEGYVVIPTNDFKKAHLNWGKKELKLVYKSMSSDVPDINADFIGDKGSATIHDEKFVFECD